jgi:two-component system sensor histidine kinase BaeS
LVTDLRTLSLVESGGVKLYKQDTALKEWLERLIESFAMRATALDTAINLELEDEKLFAHFDPEQMARVLGNLLDNALRYASPGKIEISARQIEAQTEIQVCDEGPGLPQEALEQVFERFYRGERSRTHRKDGSGLGLAIAKAIVEAHGGTLKANNHREGGCVFTIVLPNDP